MLRKLREHINGGQGGFSLIELLVVILIIGDPRRDRPAGVPRPALEGPGLVGEVGGAQPGFGIESYYATNKTYVGAAS